MGSRSPCGHCSVWEGISGPQVRGRRTGLLAGPAGLQRGPLSRNLEADGSHTSFFSLKLEHSAYKPYVKNSYCAPWAVNLLHTTALSRPALAAPSVNNGNIRSRASSGLGGVECRDPTLGPSLPLLGPVCAADTPTSLIGAVSDPSRDTAFK